MNRFSYDEFSDVYTCPAGGRLPFQRTKSRLSRTGYVEHSREYSAPPDCIQCPLRQKCTPGSSGTLTVRPNLERLRNITRENLNSPQGREFQRVRGHAVETVFGDGKFNQKRRRYVTRGLAGAQADAGLFYLAHNVKRMSCERSLHTEGVAENREPGPGLPGG